MPDSSIIAGETERGITITRVFDAPRELVFKAWTEPARFAQWFGGRDSTIPLETVAMDVRPGGAWRATMIAGPERVEIAWKGVYREVAPPERLVFTLSDQPGDDAEVVTVILTDLGGQTEMVFRQHGGHLADDEYGRAKAGWALFFDRLAEHVAQEPVITRIFDAPRGLVWKAWTEPERLARWWGPKGYTAPAIKIDLRVGGAYLYCMRSPEGQDFWSTGTFREIVPPQRLVYTDSFADEHGNVVSAAHYGMGDDFPLEMQVTVTLDEVEDGKTRLTLRHAGLPAGEMRELTVAGWNESFDKFAAALAQAR